MISVKYPVSRIHPGRCWAMWLRSRRDSVYGENDNIGALPVLSVTANLYKKDLGHATEDVKTAHCIAGGNYRGVLVIETKGLTKC